MSILMMIFGVFIIALVLLNVYQVVVQRAAIRISKGLFILSSNVIEKAKEIRRSGKDIEIVEAHLMDMHTLVGMLLIWLRSKGKIELSSFLYTRSQGHVDPLTKEWEEDSVVRLVQDIVRHLLEDHGEWEMPKMVDAVLEQLVEKVPNLEQESARRMVEAVVNRTG